MPADPHYEQFFFLFFAGLGLILAGAANLGLRRARAWVRVAATALACGVPLAGLAAFVGSGRLVPVAAAVIAGGLIPAVVAGSPRVGRFLTRLVEVSRNPVARWGGLVAAGVAVLLGSIVHFEATDQAMVSADMFALEMESYRPAGVPPVSVRAATDRGTEVHVRLTSAPRPADTLSPIEEKALRDMRMLGAVIRRHPADDRSNCHGWVFTGGRYWVTGEEVEAILSENGYREVAAPGIGDLVVYRGPDGVPAHTGIVRYVADGVPVLVEGKWGWMGVFLHPVDKSTYGTNYQFYSSPRPGHLLAGLPAPGPGVPVE